MVKVDVGNKDSYVDKKTNTESKSLTYYQHSYLGVFLNTAFFFLINPFQLDNDGWIVKRKWWSILWALSHILALHRYIIEVLQFPFERLSTGAVDYFLFIQKVSSPITYLLFLRLMWFNSEKFQKIITYINNSNYLQTRKNWLTSHTVMVMISVFSLLMGISNLILGIRITNELSYKDPILFYRRYIAQGRFALTMDRSSNEMRSMPPELKDITFTDQILAGIVFISTASRSVIGMSWESLTFVSSLTLWIPVKEFHTKLTEEIERFRTGSVAVGFMSLKIDLIMKNYQELKELSRLINDAIQEIVLSYLVEEIIYFSIHANAVFTATDWYRQFRQFAGVFWFSAVFIMSSEICNKMQVMKIWLSHEPISSLFSCQRMTILVDELSNNPVSISAGIFKITYHVSVMILSTGITYFIICSQIGSSTDTE